MNTTLVVAGFVFLAAAIIGGGLKAQGVEVPVISSISRQVLLGLAGVGAILISVLLPRNGSTASTGTSPTTVSLPSAVTITNRHDGETSCVVYLPLGNIGKMGQCGDVESPLQRIWAVRPLPGGYVQFVSAAQSGNVCLGVNDNGYVVAAGRAKMPTVRTFPTPPGGWTFAPMALTGCRTVSTRVGSGLSVWRPWSIC